MHTHLNYDTDFDPYHELIKTEAKQAINGVANARTTLMAGITTVRNVGTDSYADVDLRDAINAGQVPGPHMQVSGPALGITGGHCDNNLLPFEYHSVGEGVADGIAAVQHKVRQNIKYGADLIKICATGGVLSKGDDPQASQYTLEEMQAIVADAHRLGRKVAAHAHGAQGILWASSTCPVSGVSSLNRVSSGKVERKPVTGLPASARPRVRAVRKMVSPSGIFIGPLGPAARHARWAAECGADACPAGRDESPHP